MPRRGEREHEADEEPARRGREFHDAEERAEADREFAKRDREAREERELVEEPEQAPGGGSLREALELAPDVGDGTPAEEPGVGELLQARVDEGDAEEPAQDAERDRVLAPGVGEVEEAFAAAGTNMRDLAEMVTKSTAEAFDTVTKRMTENLEEIRASLVRKQAK